MDCTPLSNNVTVHLISEQNKFLFNNLFVFIVFSIRRKTSVCLSF